MTCACGMDSVGTCLVCGTRLCAEHALRRSERGVLESLVWNHLGVHDLNGAFPNNLQRVRADLRPLFRFPAQRQAFLTSLRGSGVICGNCRFNGAFEAAGAAPQPTAPALGAGGSQRLRDATADYLLGDAVAWDSMESDAALKDALFQDLIHLAREKAERFHVPVEWEAVWYSSPPNSRWITGEVRATEEVFHAVYVMASAGYDTIDYFPVPQYINRHGQWEPILPLSWRSPETVKTGWFSDEERVLRAKWSDEPPQPGLDNVLKRAAELLTPAD